MSNLNPFHLVFPNNDLEKPGEQAPFCIPDPSGNALEFKAFADMSALFVT